MSQIPPTATAAQTSSTPGSTAGTTKSGDILSKDSFLKLMMVELQHQDPLQPSDPTQYITQLSQLTTLEQTTNLAASSAQTAAQENTVAALQLLGHSVTYIDSTGTSQSGTVQKVQLTDAGPTLTISGVAGIDPATVSEVS